MSVNSILVERHIIDTEIWAVREALRLAGPRTRPADVRRQETRCALRRRGDLFRSAFAAKFREIRRPLVERLPLFVDVVIDNGRTNSPFACLLRLAAEGMYGLLYVGNSATRSQRQATPV